jgi:UDP-N-acetylglucosamine 1-carboxyvinyltransferase
LEKLVIEGGKPLEGTVRIHGAKNAALPILAASILSVGPHLIENVPDLLDIKVMLHILQSLGCETKHEHETVTINSARMKSSHIPEQLMAQMRSSIFLMGPLLARFGSVQIYQPGGCAIGERKINLHLAGLRSLGAKIHEAGNTIICSADRLKGAEIKLDFPSVGATENMMMAAASAEGVSVIHGAAREPEIEDLQSFLNAMGASISGAGTDTITIEGVDQFRPCRYRVIPDRIVAGTLMVATAASGGDVMLEGVRPDHLRSITHVLRSAGVEVNSKHDIIKIKGIDRPRRIERIVTSPHPSFPTDLQAQIMVLLALADGMSIVKETIFEGRFQHVDELIRMGADIQVNSNMAFVRGVPRLYGTTVKATDLRAGAALVIAGIAARGTTVVEQIHHIDRGYAQIETMFNQIGANISRYSPVPT